MYYLMSFLNQSIVVWLSDTALWDLSARIIEKGWRVNFDTCIPIEYMNLTARAYNVLKRAGYTYISQLEHITPNGFNHVRGCGDMTTKEIMTQVNNWYPI